MKFLKLVACLAPALFAGCMNVPIGADRVSPERAYNQVEESALGSGRLSSSTVALLNRYDLKALAESEPTEALTRLHRNALKTGERDLLFALAELSYHAGRRLAAPDQVKSGIAEPRNRVRRDDTPQSERDVRDYYLGASVYAYLFLFGEAVGEKPDGFDRRHRLACDLYNYGLGLALAGSGDAAPVVRFEDGKRRLPFGEIGLRLDATRFQLPMADVDAFLMADQFSVKGMSVRNRKGGVGVPLITLGRQQADLQVRRAAPSTVFLRLPGSLREIERGGAEGVLELFSMFDAATVSVNGTKVPLEADFTAARAYVLGQRYAWASGRMMFLSPQPALKSQLIMSEPYRPGRIPLVLVHGTFSSPARWAEMINTLNADPVIRSRYQIWMFLYGSSQPILISADLLRTELTATLARLDPEGRDEALRRMVVIGHSQGGLLTKLTATDTGNTLWQQFSKKSPEELDMTAEQRETIQRLAFSKPLPFVETVVFIATPHRGSYRSVGFVRHLVRKLVSLPQATLQVTSDLMTGVQGIESPEMFNGFVPSSVDGMSPKNPVMLALADIPVAPGIDAHSIIAANGGGPLEKSNDGVVAYASSHVDYVRSEFVVKGSHSCQSMPAVIEEVRRILREHVDGLSDADTAVKGEAAKGTP